MNKSQNLPVLTASASSRFRGSIIDVLQELPVPTKEELIMASQRQSAHINAKRISRELVEKAADNKPFGDYAGFVTGQHHIDQDKIAQAVEQFLTGTFGGLKGGGVSYSILTEANKDENAAVNEYIKRFKTLGFEGQADAVRDQYTSFVGLKKCLRIMYQQGTLRPESFLPMEYLPEVFVAAPVWFSTKNAKAKSGPGFREYICSQFPNQDGADLFQMYNLDTRELRKFAGKDIMPPNILEVVPSATEAFDYVAIATPYHDLASDVWEDLRWQRNVDPFLLGFMVGVPIIFMLGRWSASGMFPLFLDMVADTMNHLKTNTDLLDNFSSDDWIDRSIPSDGYASREGRQLVSLSEKLVNAFNKDQLFNVLRTPA